jgi:hypothetical protein
MEVTVHLPVSDFAKVISGVHVQVWNYADFTNELI